jgi:FkbM family methyltransferase
MSKHHHIFEGAETWCGRVPDHVDVCFLGAFEDRQFFLPQWRDRPRDFAKLHDQWTNLPTFDEEYFEWIDFLAAVRTARERFVMELGAGYGRWLMRAAAAIRRYNPVPYLLIGVEGEPTHVEWMKLNFRNNGLDPIQHRLIHAAVGATDGVTYFPTGDPYEWGQFILETPRTGPQRSTHQDHVFDVSFLSQTAAVPQITIETAAGGEHLIDLIDMDIQGAEAEVMEQAIDFCSTHVRLIHIGTHTRAIEDRLRGIFGNAGWLPRFDFPNNSTTPTKYGALDFNDGVQSWANRRFADRLIAAGLMES